MSPFIQQIYKLADQVSALSLNRGTKVGAVIYDPVKQSIACAGANNLPEGLDPDDDRYHTKPLKLIVWEHSERNAIYAAASMGIRTRGLGMAVNWYPCAECARAIVQAGIVELVASEPDWSDERWNASWLAAREILAAAKVAVHYVVREEALSAPKAGVLIQFPDPELKVLSPADNPLQPIVS